MHQIKMPAKSGSMHHVTNARESGLQEALMRMPLWTSGRAVGMLAR